MLNEILDQAVRMRAEEEPFVIATVVAYKSPQSARPGSKAIIKPDGSINGWIGGGCVQPIILQEAQKTLKTGKPRLISISPEAEHGDWKGVEVYQMTCQGGGSLEIYLEPILPSPHFFIIGKSPIAQMLSGFGRQLDFKVYVVDPDARKEQFPDAHVVLNDLESIKTRIDSQSYVVVATMGTGDEEGLEAAVTTNPKYLGLVASKEKAKSLFQYIQDRETPAEKLDRIKCPAGLELGGETLPEIALSVMAEITQLRRNRSEIVVDVVEQPEKILDLTVMPEMASVLRTDPVCGMEVDISTARYTTFFANTTFYFCCLRCKDAFEGAPEHYHQHI